MSVDVPQKAKQTIENISRPAKESLEQTPETKKEEGLTHDPSADLENAPTLGQGPEEDAAAWIERVKRQDAERKKKRAQKQKELAERMMRRLEEEEEDIFAEEDHGTDHLKGS